MLFRSAWLPLGVSIPARIGIVASFPLALLAVGFFPPADLAAARARLGRLLKRP